MTAPDPGQLRHIIYIEDNTGALIAQRWASIEDKPGLPVAITFRHLPVLTYAHRLRLGVVPADFGLLTAAQLAALTASQFASMDAEGAPPRYFRIADIDEQSFGRVYQVVEGSWIGPLVHQLTLQSPARSTSSKSGEIQLTWSNTSARWGAVKELAARDQTNYAKTVGIVTHEISLLNDPANPITKDQRFVFNGRTLNIIAIKDVDGHGIELLVQTSEVQ